MYIIYFDFTFLRFLYKDLMSEHALHIHVFQRKIVSIIVIDTLMEQCFNPYEKKYCCNQSPQTE